MRATNRNWAAIGALFIVAIVLIVAPGAGLLADRRETLRVVFFDVGQGDSIFIESPTGVQVLIDSGPNRAVLGKLGREMGFWDRSLDIVIATHEDRDHVGGMLDIFNRYDISLYVRTENEGESREAEAINALSLGEGAEIVYARRGMIFDLGGGAELEILFPDREPGALESNASSIVARLTYGDSEFLFTGDAPKAIEEYLVLLDGDGLRSDVIKAGHHGSRTSTSEPFVSAVRPQFAVISAAKNNRYGHPHREVLDVFEKNAVRVLSTAEAGTITFEADGERVLLKE